MLLALVSMQQIQELNNTSIKDFLNENKVSIITFYSSTCPACQTAKPILEELIKFGRLDCLSYFDTCEEFKIRGWPNTRLFINGNYIQRYQNVQEIEAYEDWLDDILDDKQL